MTHIDHAAMRPYADPNNPGNASEYHTGKPCIERGCDKPAGTVWGELWCWECNRDRIDRIDGRMTEIAAAFGIER